MNTHNLAKIITYNKMNTPGWPWTRISPRHFLQPSSCDPNIGPTSSSYSWCSDGITVHHCAQVIIMMAAYPCTHKHPRTHTYTRTHLTADGFVLCYHNAFLATFDRWICDRMSKFGNKNAILKLFPPDFLFRWEKKVGDIELWGLISDEILDFVFFSSFWWFGISQKARNFLVVGIHWIDDWRFEWNI